MEIPVGLQSPLFYVRFVIVWYMLDFSMESRIVGAFYPAQRGTAPTKRRTITRDNQLHFYDRKWVTLDKRLSLFII